MIHETWNSFKSNFMFYFILLICDVLVLYIIMENKRKKTLLIVIQKNSSLSLKWWERKKHTNSFLHTFVSTEGIVELHHWVSLLLSLWRFVAKVTERDQWPFHYVASYYKASFSQGHYEHAPTLIEGKPSAPIESAAGGSCSQLYKQIYATSWCNSWVSVYSWWAIMWMLLMIMWVLFYKVTPLHQDANILL